MSTLVAVGTGGTAGIILGVVLQRGQLCFHAAVVDAYAGRTTRARGWALGVAGAAVGLSLLYLVPGTSGLNQGLAFTPIANISGGLLIGVGMAVARTCVSGLFYKLGAGMLGASVGILGWGAGELVARTVPVPGPRVLPGGVEGTIPGLLGLPRLWVALVVLGAVAVWLWRRPGRAAGASRVPAWQWGWGRTGLGLALAITVGWVLAAIGGAGFGPSSVGAVSSIASGTPNTWLLSFLVGITVGGALAAWSTGALEVRGERPVRYLQLVGGGFLLGAGGWIAGGCNLGHGLSGMAQLNVSSVVVVAAIAVGVGLTHRLRLRWAPAPATTR